MGRATTSESKGAIATFIIDWPVLVFLGLVFGHFAPDARWWRSRAFVAGLVTAVVFTTTAMLSYLIAPDWMWMYYVEPNVVRWVVPLIPATYLIAFGLGFWSALGLRLTHRGSVLLAAAVMLALEVAMVAFTWDRYHLVGSRQQWLSGDAAELISLAPSGAAKSIGLMGPVFIVVLIVGLLIARRSVGATVARR